MRRFKIIREPLELSGLRVVSSTYRVDLINQIFNAIERGDLEPGKLLEVAQYDLSSSSAPSTSKSAVKSIAKSINQKPHLIIRETSRTLLFTILVYYAIQDLLENNNLYLYPEPNLIEIGKTFDYAVVDETRKNIVFLAEVKRLRAINNLISYIEEFDEKLNELKRRTILDHIDATIFHLHLTPIFIRESREVEQLLRSFGKLINNQNISMLLTITSGESFNKLTEDLKQQLSMRLQHRKKQEPPFNI
ncbi:MAG: hypothetical protein QXQ57_04750 [Sulfolobales archaeon]